MSLRIWIARLWRTSSFWWKVVPLGLCPAIPSRSCWSASWGLHYPLRQCGSCWLISAEHHHADPDVKVNLHLVSGTRKPWEIITQRHGWSRVVFCGKVVSLQLQQHALQFQRGWGQWLVQDHHQRFVVSDDLKGPAVEVGVELLDAEDHTKELSVSAAVACFCIGECLWNKTDGLAILDKVWSVGRFAVSKYFIVILRLLVWFCPCRLGFGSPI